MLTGIENLLLTEKYRPSSFDALILAEKEKVKSLLAHPKTLPSLIFYSQSPGTGKTSTAKVIINTLQCDSLLINSSDERGIDTIREKIKNFVRGMSSNEELKKCVFLDEADGLTRQAQDSLRNLMETYSDNCFFIFSCNDLSKLIEPIRSRCLSLGFDRPSKPEILTRLELICVHEKYTVPIEDLMELLERKYPDIRSMISTLQLAIASNTPIVWDTEYQAFLHAMQTKDIPYLYEKSFSNNFDILGFNRWFFKYLFENYKKFGLEKCSKIAMLLADTEKNWNLGANLQIIFITNIVDISKQL
jgi:replication factor C small subunit